MSQKEAKDVHVTVEPEAVREMRWNGTVGRLSDVTSSCEMMLNFPKHIESTAQIVAACSGGGAVAFGGHKKPMNLGGASNSGAASMAETVQCRSGSDVTDESESTLS